MSFIQRIIEALDARLWKFIRIVHSANHDYPYHDYKKLVNPDEGSEHTISYAVGENCKDSHGDQSKFFVSKRMLVWSFVDCVTVHLNDSRNPAIPLLPRYLDNANVARFFLMEFHTNINVVFVTVPADESAYLYFEGVLPEEARDAE